MSFETRVREHWPDRADEILDIVRGSIEPENYKSVAEWVARRYNPPSRRECQMRALNEILGGYGNEAIFESDRYHRPAAEYVNLGDTYAPTILLDYGKGLFFVTSWGDWLESAENAGRVFE